MNKKSIPYRVWHRIVRATKTNDAQVSGVCTMWLFTTLGGLMSKNSNIPIWYCICIGSIWVLVAFIINLFYPLDED